VGIEIELQVNSHSRALPHESDFRRWISSSLEGYNTQVEVVVRIVDEEESADLNQTYRGKPGPTNVLSFPFEAPAQVDTDLLGDLVICAPVIEREALEQGKTLESHWAHMAVHGTLHLLGFDHLSDAQAAEMELLEKDVLTRMGYGNPYEDND